MLPLLVILIAIANPAFLCRCKLCATRTTRRQNRVNPVLII